jgi:hypothetical protein
LSDKSPAWREFQTIGFWENRAMEGRRDGKLALPDLSEEERYGGRGSAKRYGSANHGCNSDGQPGLLGRRGLKDPQMGTWLWIPSRSPRHRRWK